MKERGFEVTGSDQNVYPPMSTFLAERGIAVMSGYTEANLAHRPDLVVIGNAISRGNPEAEVALERKLRYCSLPEVLRHYFLQGRRSLVVTGTHGKTTTSSLLAWVFEHNGRRPSYFIGGLPENLGQGARFSDSEWFILEGDEYDTAFFDKRSKFVHYQPEVAIINNLEMDHADIFDDLAAVRRSFSHFIRLIPRNGLLLANGDDPQVRPLLDEARHYPARRFGLGEDNDFQATALRLDADGSRFTLAASEFHLPLVGELNVRNALAVVACARHCGFTDEAIRSAFATFKGVRRRMEVLGVVGGVAVVDDFGHHPTAIRETLRALRVRFRGRRLWALFEPRSNTTRRNVFQNELVDALECADEIVVGEVARIEQLAVDQRLNPEKLIADLALRGRSAAYLPTVEAIVSRVAERVRPDDVVCVFSNGGFGGVHSKLLQRLSDK
jgi:UDP-N-acetylmuramate: L-alanyl-gamma-D-glutamyl-meso-diaminopimelate ligase